VIDDIFIAVINAASSIAIAGVLITAILSKRVRDGVVIKVGLSCIALGFVVISLHMFSGADVQGLERSLLLINSGITVVIIGYLWRSRSAGHALRRLTDWAELDSKEP
jgi:hypothetical protein